MQNFLSLLHGVIDSPNVPLEFIKKLSQSDANVKKINTPVPRKLQEIAIYFCAMNMLTKISGRNQHFREVWDDFRRKKL
ncbi:MAG: hypothetical protein IPN46_18375 [Saprospiraceae bacterium]|nr:hypothetical protein [Saprospiraceae bacterium]